MSLLLSVALALTPLAVTMADQHRYPPAVREARQWLRGHVHPGNFRCLHRLWEKESGWSPRARNRVSGAFGIPQFYPAPRSRYRHKPMWQVRKGLRYIRGRYGTPCHALTFQSARGWY